MICVTVWRGMHAWMHAQSLSCVRLCDPMDHSPPGSSVHGIFQAGIRERVAIPFSTEEVYFIKVNLVTKYRVSWLRHQLNDFGGGLVTKSCLTLATPWTIAHQSPLSMGFSRQEYRSGLPFHSPLKKYILYKWTWWQSAESLVSATNWMTLVVV